MKKILKIKSISAPSKIYKYITFQIIEQSHRGSNFGDESSDFSASNGIVLASSLFPQIGYTAFYVRGTNHDEDDKILKTTSKTFERIQFAIQEYNNFFNGKKISIGQDDYIKRIGISYNDI